MARKGNQHKNGLGRSTSNHKNGGLQLGSTAPIRNGKGNVSGTNVVNGEELSRENQPTISVTEALHHPNHVKDDKKSKNKSGKHSKVEMQGTAGTSGLEQSEPCGSNGECSADMSTTGSSLEEEKLASANGISGSNNRKRNLGCSSNGWDQDGLQESVELPDNMNVMYLKTFMLSVSKASTEWFEKHKPMIDIIVNKILISRDYVRMNIKCAYPIVLRWLTQFANILLILSMVWLDCTLRGIHSVLRMGTTAFFAVIWCSIFSVVAMIGVLKFFIVGAIVALLGLFVGVAITLLLLAVSAIVFLWLYGSFWTTLLVLLFAGLTFTFSHEHLALLIMTVYSVYCVWMLVGWLGLILALNLSFISSNTLIFFLRNNLNEQRRSNSAPEETAGMQSGPGVFAGDRVHVPPSDSGTSPSADRSPGAPSTSGADSDLTSEEEVLRLLNSTDHYSALGLSRFQEIDASILKLEYRKKAMLVHPDKNMGNEKAAEAFKKLQNAYEVLLDTFKRKAYDDELRREDLLNYFRRFQNASPKNKKHGFFGSTFRRTEVDVEDPRGESRRIACRKCGGFHLWFHTKKTKSRARWCQDCKDFHQAKDGDGWVEQSSHSLLFGIFQKADAPCAYVCADSKIYDATELYICQGMRCPANTHKPSFHVNTNVRSKHANGKGQSSSQKGGMPSFNMEETMTEEEFMEWLQNAVQAGMFDNFTGNASEAGNSSKSESTSKAGGSDVGGSISGSKRKKKGKKW